MTPFLKRRYSSQNCGGVKFLITFFPKARWEHTFSASPRIRAPARGRNWTTGGLVPQ